MTKSAKIVWSITSFGGESIKHVLVDNDSSALLTDSKDSLSRTDTAIFYPHCIFYTFLKII